MYTYICDSVNLTTYIMNMEVLPTTFERNRDTVFSHHFAFFQAPINCVCV